MESLRWILLAVGIVFVIAIYFIGRRRKQRNDSVIDILSNDDESDFPEFSAQSLDDVDEGVGQVRVVTQSASRSVLAADEEDVATLSVTAGDEQPAESPAPNTKNNTGKDAVNDIVVLYILPKPNCFLAGSQINSSVQAMGLVFGEMNIFHYMDKDRSVFSLANMLEPGSFDAKNIHELKTSGLTIFMQMQIGDPLDDLTEMLQRSYQLAGLLDARLCNHKREPLTEQHAESYRVRVAEFIAAKKNTDTVEPSPEFSSET